MNELYMNLANGLLDVILSVIAIVFAAVVLPWIKETGIPWLKEKRMYSICQRLVMAAEKLAESDVIDTKMKKDYVLEILAAKGITVTPEIDAYIESAVEELDLMIESGVIIVGDAFETDSISPKEHQAAIDAIAATPNNEMV